MKEKVREIDTELGKLMKTFDDRGLTKKVNILITADHGMTDVSNTRSINIGQYIDIKNDVEWSYLSAIGLIDPKPDKLEQVNKLLMLLHYYYLRLVSLLVLL